MTEIYEKSRFICRWTHHTLSVFGCIHGIIYCLPGKQATTNLGASILA